MEKSHTYRATIAATKTANPAAADTTALTAPPVNAAWLVEDCAEVVVAPPAPPELEPAGAAAPPVVVGAGVELPAGAADVAAMEEAADDAAGEEAAVVEAGAEDEAMAAEEDPEPADAAQTQTAEAEVWTARPVTGPQPLRTQPKAALLMAADFAGMHWQAKSVVPQPAPEAADWIQETWESRQLVGSIDGRGKAKLTAQDGTLAATAAHWS